MKSLKGGGKHREEIKTCSAEYPVKTRLRRKRNGRVINDASYLDMFEGGNEEDGAYAIGKRAGHFFFLYTPNS